MYSSNQKRERSGREHTHVTVSTGGHALWQVRYARGRAAHSNVRARGAVILLLGHCSHGTFDEAAGEGGHILQIQDGVSFYAQRAATLRALPICHSCGKAGEGARKLLD